MNSIFTAKLLQNLRNKKANKGFTLIELLVVVIIIGVLAAVALPNLLAQVGKARESEGKTAVGSVNRSQQAFHFERQSFADTTTDIEATDNQLGVVVNPDFYGFAIASAADGQSATVAANSLDPDNNGTRDYAGGITFNAGSYSTILCQSNTVGGGIVIADVDAATDACGANAAELD